MRSQRNPYRREKTEPERPPSCRPQQSTFLKRDKRAGSSKLSLQEHRNVSNVAPGTASLAGRAGLLLALIPPPRRGCARAAPRSLCLTAPRSGPGPLCQPPPSRPPAGTLGLAAAFPPPPGFAVADELRPSVPLAASVCPARSVRQPRSLPPGSAPRRSAHPLPPVLC